jgi:hypothetical protein
VADHLDDIYVADRSDCLFTVINSSAIPDAATFNCITVNGGTARILQTIRNATAVHKVAVGSGGVVVSRNASLDFVLTLNVEADAY